MSGLSEDQGWREETVCARAPGPVESATKPLVPALEPSVVYRIASLDQVDRLYEGGLGGFVYGRDGHPNGAQLAVKVAALEGGESAWAGSSGMAVEAAALLTLVRSGDRVALAEGVYGKTGRLVEHLGRFGVEVDRFDATDAGTLRAVVGERTRVVFAETLSNPLVRLADVGGLAEVAGGVGAALIVDQTFAPLLCRPLELGAALVTHSATKFLGGHSDLTLGVIAGDSEAIGSIAATGSTYGMAANPYECWLCLRGLATLAVRVERSCATALELAARLEGHRAVGRVHYPGLPSHPDHRRAERVLGGRFGAMVTIDVGGRESADRLIRGLAGAIPFAPSLGDTATTLSHPATTSHRNQSAEQWARQGITAGLVRISVGLEDVEDLWDELRGALDRL
ncbi:MAG: cystathionine gamma-synthase [Isosphaeraceae bacterium]|nr:MAG: cystathionine gamma-synthase [Isosphaeraceae bacterium]